MKALSVILLSSLVIFLNSSCIGVQAEKKGKVIYLSIQSVPSSADAFWRIVSNTPEVRSSNRFYLGTTPYRKTRSLNIPGLTKSNAHRVSVLLEIEKRGYYERIEQFNMASVLDHLVINVKYHLIKSDGKGDSSKSTKKKSSTKSALAPPKNLRASDGKYPYFVKLKWKKVKGAKGYHIYRNNRKIGVTRATRYIDIRVKRGRRYYYKVRAYKDKEQSSFSNADEGYSKPFKKKVSQNKKPETGSPSGSKTGSGSKVIPIIGIIPIPIGKGSGKKDKKEEVKKDSYEPNDTRFKARTIYLNRPYRCTLHHNGDIDYYKVYLSRRTKYRIELSRILSGGKYKVELVNRSSKAVYEGISGGDGRLSLRFRLKNKGYRSGVYYIKVSRLSGALGRYRLKVSIVR